MSEAGNTGHHGTVNGSKWQIFIEFWAEACPHFLPWVRKALAPMAPVSEGKAVGSRGFLSAALAIGRRYTEGYLLAADPS